MSDAAQYPLEEQIQCVQREIARRRAGYRRLIADALLTRPAADREIGLMESIEQSLRSLQSAKHCKCKPSRVRSGHG